MVPNLWNKIKAYQYNLFLVCCIGLIALISYNLGRIDALGKGSISIKEEADRSGQNNSFRANIYSATQSETDNPQPEIKKLDTRVVGSKNSDKYHYTWCAGAKKIKEENHVWFNSAQEAESKGYTLAGNCSP